MTRIIKPDNPPKAPDARSAVMNLADIAAEARSIVLDARKDAARIVAEAREKSEEVRLAAAEKGYAEGLARGQNDGYADGQKRGFQQASQDFQTGAAGLLDLAGKIVAELSAARADLLLQARSEMIDLSLELAEKIVGRVAAGDASAARENLGKVLDLANRSHDVTVRVHPAQLEALRQHVGQFAQTLETGEIHLVGDERVSPGGVYLSAGQGEIDATIETQLANVAEALVGRGDAGRYESAARGRADGLGYRHHQAMPIAPAGN